MTDIWIQGVGMSRFGRFFDRSLSDIAAEAVDGVPHGDGGGAPTREHDERPGPPRPGGRGG